MASNAEEPEGRLGRAAYGSTDLIVGGVSLDEGVRQLCWLAETVSDDEQRWLFACTLDLDEQALWVAIPTYPDPATEAVSRRWLRTLPTDSARVSVCGATHPGRGESPVFTDAPHAVLPLSLDGRGLTAAMCSAAPPGLVVQTDDDLFDAYWHLAQAAPFGDVAWARNVLEIVPDQGWLMNVAGVMTEHGYRAQLRDLDTEAPRLSLDKLIDVLGPVLHGAHA